MAGVIELAREYAEKNVSLATSMYNPQAETIAAYSFADGYKAALEGANGWHNIKQNPQDLPTEDGKYLIVEKQYGEVWYDTAYFITGVNAWGENIDVIAWHKIPAYKGEI